MTFPVSQASPATSSAPRRAPAASHPHTLTTCPSSPPRRVSSLASRLAARSPSPGPRIVAARSLPPFARLAARTASLCHTPRRHSKRRECRSHLLLRHRSPHRPTRHHRLRRTRQPPFSLTPPRGLATTPAHQIHRGPLEAPLATSHVSPFACANSVGPAHIAAAIWPGCLWQHAFVASAWHCSAKIIVWLHGLVVPNEAAQIAPLRRLLLQHSLDTHPVRSPAKNRRAGTPKAPPVTAKAASGAERIDNLQQYAIGQ